tara:strand:- start:185763 stop:186866 length:1104 start_codon:yes stop_codon:yes gene_type:complete
MTTNILFSEFKSTKLSLKNRIVMAPMTRSQSPGHIPTSLSVDYYRRRAEGGVGLIITEGINIDDPSSAGYSDVPILHGEALSAWKLVTGAVHECGQKIAAQIWHVGCNRSKDFDLDNNIPSVSPSGIYYLGPEEQKHSVSELSLKQTEEIIESFARAAANAKEAGFDAIELHGAHGYLIDQFFWDKTNQRTDRFGGDTLKERTRFAQEILKACRRQVGSEFPIIFRFSNWKLGAYDHHLFQSSHDLEQFLEPLTAAGVDIFHASTRNLNTPEFDNSNLNLAGWTKKISGLPTISVGSVGLEQDFIQSFTKSPSNSIDPLIERLESDEFDLVAVGRALLADPHWAKKVESGDFSNILPYTPDCLSRLY